MTDKQRQYKNKFIKYMSLGNVHVVVAAIGPVDVAAPCDVGMAVATVNGDCVWGDPVVERGSRVRIFDFCDPVVQCCSLINNGVWRPCTGKY